MERVISGQLNWMQQLQSLDPCVRGGLITHGSSSSSLLCYSAHGHVFFSLTKHSNNPMMAEAVRDFSLAGREHFANSFWLSLSLYSFDCWYWPNLISDTYGLIFQSWSIGSAKYHHTITYKLIMHWSCTCQSRFEVMLNAVSFLLTFLTLISLDQIDTTNTQDKAQYTDVHTASVSAFVLDLVHNWK